MVHKNKVTNKQINKQNYQPQIMEQKKLFYEDQYPYLINKYGCINNYVSTENHKKCRIPKTNIQIQLIVKINNNKIISIIAKIMSLSSENNTSQKHQTKNSSKLPLQNPTQKQSKQLIIDESFIQGKWNIEQNIKFVIFIILNKTIFKSKEKRKAERIFKNLSIFVSTRNSRQCRSHFQKLMKKFNTIVKMKKYYRNLIGAKYFDQQLISLTNQVQNLAGSDQHINKNNSQWKKTTDTHVQTIPFKQLTTSYETFHPWNIFYLPQQIYYAFPSYY